MNAVKATDLEPIPGYRLLEPLGKGGFGEVWRCEAPGGLYKAIKFVAGTDDNGLHRDRSGAEQELRAFNLIKTIRHPFILSVDRVECVENELLIVMELADRSLYNVLVSWQKGGQPGIPRGELVSYLREAAEALDVMNLEYGLQHLDIKPRNLFLVGGHVKVGDFGLVSSLVDLSSGTLNLGSITPQYTAPESFVGKITLFTDQYSLAIAYHELLTGTFPFEGRNFRQLALQHSSQPPNLGRLSETDRAVVGRALAKDPRQRYPSCMEFVSALWAIPSPPSPQRLSRRVPVLKLEAASPSHLPPEMLVSSRRETMPDMPIPTEPSAAGAATATAVAPSAPVPAPVQPSNIAAVACDLALSTPTADSAGAVVPGYQFIECVGRSAAGEVWKARSAKGALRIVKLVAGFDPQTSTRPGGPLDRLRALKHPVLEAVEIIVAPGERLAIISNPMETTLADRLRGSMGEGRAGVPRSELLGCLAEAARCLDELNRDQQLRHLALTPRSLALTPVGIRLIDFGLAELVWLPGGLQPSALNPRYTAPELLAGQVKPTSDQYSLALIYLEMLTGVHPLRNLSPRQLATHKGHRPDVSLVPAPDRPPVLRALSVDPDRRFHTCAEFVRALTDASPEGDAPPAPPARSVTIADSNPTLVSLPQLNKLLGEVVARARGRLEVHTIGEARYLLHPGCKIEHHCRAALLPTALKVQLHGFRQQWDAKVVASEAHSHVFHVSLGSSLWQRLLGRTAGLQVIIRFHHPDDVDALTPVTVEIMPVGSLAEQAAALLVETGPKLLESVRAHLQVLPERRREERLRFDQAVPVTPIHEYGRKGRMLAARTVNISAGGMRLLLPCRPPTEELLIELAAPSAPNEPVDLPAQVVRVDANPDGSFDVGVSFRLK
jgi:serine/threonine protein kinase